AKAARHPWAASTSVASVEANHAPVVTSPTATTATTKNIAKGPNARSRGHRSRSVISLRIIRFRRHRDLPPAAHPSRMGQHEPCTGEIRGLTVFSRPDPFSPASARRRLAWSPPGACGRLLGVRIRYAARTDVGLKRTHN